MTPQRTLSALVVVLLLLVCGTASAQDAPATARLAHAAKVAASYTLGGPHASDLTPLPNALLLRRTTNAVFAALSSGLILKNIKKDRSESWLYVNFGRDAMPSVRWLTRF